MKVVSAGASLRRLRGTMRNLKARNCACEIVRPKAARSRCPCTTPANVAIAIRASIPAAGYVSAATPGVMEEFPQDAIFSCLNRHENGDWGDLSDDDKHANRDTLDYGARILSSYNVRGDKIWIITDAERENTTIMLPSAY